MPIDTSKTDAEVLLQWQSRGNGPPPGGRGPACATCGESTWVEIGGGSAADAYHPNLDVIAGPNVDVVFDFESGKLPLHDGHADKIKMIHCLNHLHAVTAEAMLDDCWRVLKPGGSLYIMVTDAEFVASRIAVDGMRECWMRCLWGTMGDTYASDFHYWGYSPSSLKQLLRKHGFGRIMDHGPYNAWEFKLEVFK